MHTVDLYRKVRLACRDGMSERAAARYFGIARESVRKMLRFSVPPGYRRTAPIRRPKLDGFTELIDQCLSEDRTRPRKQGHTAKRVFDRLRGGALPGVQVGRGREAAAGRISTCVSPRCATGSQRGNRMMKCCAVDATHHRVQSPVFYCVSLRRSPTGCALINLIDSLAVSYWAGKKHVIHLSRFSSNSRG